MTAFRACAVVPTLDNPITVRGVVESLRQHGLDVILIDDGSGVAGRRACEALAEERLVTLKRLEKNRGKGAAVKAGFQLAAHLGFSHALQVDADAQHDLVRVPAFLDAAREHPDALVLGYPLYDDRAPRVRQVARRFTHFWVALEVADPTAIRDAMIGFRVYPLDATRRIGRTGNRMDFDIEIAVRLVRAGIKTVNLPVRVRYPCAEEGGVSHFRILRDNLRFSWLHTRLCTTGCLSWLTSRVSGGGR